MDGLPFRLEIIEADTNWIVSCSSECGEAMIRVPAPYSEDELRAALAEVETSLTRSFSAVVTRRASQTERPVRDFGERLSGTVLRDDIFIQFDRCRSLARSQGKSLRILIRTNGPRVERIPWEYLVDPTRDDYLALRVPVVRCLRLMNPVPPLDLTPPLRVLGISARPSDLPALDEQREREKISQVLQQNSSDNVDVQWLPGDHWQDLANALRSGTWHVLHCVCHGGFDKERNAGYIELSGDDGSAMSIYASDFERLIADGTHLRLIVLNACDSAVSGAEDVFTSTAANLVRAGVPAVVAMQHEITDQAAFLFASSFYERIAVGLPVDRAVTLAREEVKMRLGSLEWATPVLFLASDQTKIFSVPKERAANPPPDPPPPPVACEETPPPELTSSDGEGTPSDPQPSLQRRPLRKIGVLAEVGVCGHVALGPRNLLAAACDDGLVRVFDAVTGRLAGQCMPIQRDRPIRLAWSPWARHVASRHEGGNVVIWDLQTEVPVRVMNVGAGQGNAIAFSSDGHWLALTVRDHIWVYDANGVRARDLPVGQGRKGGAWQSGQHGWLGPMGFAPGDRHVVVAGTDGIVRQLDVRGGSVATWPHPQSVLALAIAEDALATGCLDGRVRLWSWDGHLLRRTEHGPQPAHLAFSSDASMLAISDDGGTVTLWDVRTGQATAAAKTTSRPVGVAFLEGGKGLVNGTHQGVIERWALPDWMVAQGGVA